MTRAGAAVLGAALLAAACGGSGGSVGAPSAQAGEAAGRALLGGVGAASAGAWPARCWMLTDEAASLDLPGAGGKLVVGVVGDARGAGPEALAAAGRAAAAFAAAKVDVVVSLGGQGTTAAEIEAVLGALAGAERPLYALPGDTEDAAAHAQATAALAARGLPVVDAAAAGVVVVRGAVLGFAPGRPLGDDGRWHGLAAGAAGCGRSADEEAAFAARWAAAGDARAPRLLFAHDPPRQVGDDGTDVALGGVHAGEPGLGALGAGARVVVHAGLDEAAGKSARTGERLIVASGALAPGAATDVPSAVIVELVAGRARARAVPLAITSPARPR